MIHVSRQLVSHFLAAVFVPVLAHAQGAPPAQRARAGADAGREPAVVTAANDAAVPRDIRQLGGSTRFYRTPLTNVASVRRMSADPRTTSSLRDVMTQAGIGQLSDTVIATLSSAETAYPGVACVEAAPQVGVLVECEVRPGETLEWMAFRPGGRSPTVVRNVRWAGAASFRAYLFRLKEGDRLYTFVVPQECGNVSLLAVNDAPRPAEPAAPAVVAAPAPVPQPPPPAPVAPPAPPPPPPPPEPTLAAPVQPETTARPLAFFADATFGKERRVRPFDDDAVLEADEEFAQCTPLFGVKAGVARRFANNWELAGGAGVAFSLVDEDEKVREHALFIDVEANKYIGRVFVGGGATFWDLTRSDTFTPGVLVHAGLPLADNVRVPIYFLIEGRLFFDGIDEIDNNYQFWGGLRLRF